jgi:hypothetical protein
VSKPVTPKRANPYDNPEWRRMRLVVLARQHWRCLWCGKSLRGKGAARVDHIETARDRPDLFMNPNNLRGLCPTCDAGRHAEKGYRGKAVIAPAIGADGFPVDSDGDLWRSKRTVDVTSGDRAIGRERQGHLGGIFTGPILGPARMAR